ncbi:MAG TPA: DUF1861 family protein [Candidatus Gallacutalibacter stercoravium]|nr:DUF1861 family protein [Candidatus Gallacutalibacter stercoravium]
MGIAENKAAFEQNRVVYEAAKLTFHGVEGYDVYNTSIPFFWKGTRYLFGRVERRGEWARSWARLFYETGKDDWTLVPGSMIYQLEDPYIAKIGDELVMGGTHVRYRQGAVETYYGYFYRGTEVDDLYYFTTGPDYMKDIRLVELADKRVGVFSRPRNEEITKKFGSDSMIGFSVINSVKELTSDVVENAPYIEGLFGPGEWGGCNQAYLLKDGCVGVIGHESYRRREESGVESLVYLNMAFVLDPKTRAVSDKKIIATRSSYPAGPSKMPDLTDCAFTSGIVARADGKVDLYSGLSDCEEGRIVIDDPFAGHGGIVEK